MDSFHKHHKSHHLELGQELELASRHMQQKRSSLLQQIKGFSSFL
jgi:hypothetical protein